MSEGRPDDATRTLAWDSGRAELQRLGAMLGPVWFSADGHPDFAPLQVAPWHAERNQFSGIYPVLLAAFSDMPR